MRDHANPFPKGPLVASRIAGRIGGALFAAGAAATVLAMLLPHPAATDETGFWVLAGIQALLAALLFGVRARSAERWLPGLTLLGAIAAVSAAIYLNGERLGGPPLMNEFYYLWPAVYAGYFFTRRVIALVLGTIVATYAGVLGSIGVPADALPVRVLVTMSVVAGTAATAHALRMQVDGLLARLAGLARTDALTGLLNRRGFDERFDLELTRCERSGESLALVLGDIDHFKALNDSFGHAAGDEALAAVAVALSGTLRAGDAVARVGGEEFAVLLPSATLVGAHAVAERLREAVCAVRTDAGQGLRMSFGVAATAPGEPLPATALMAFADRALYAAKAQGRDRSVAYADPAPVA